MNSSGHKANILSKEALELGVGLYYKKISTLYTERINHMVESGAGGSKHLQRDFGDLMGSYQWLKDHPKFSLTFGAEAEGAKSAKKGRNKPPNKGASRPAGRPS